MGGRPFTRRGLIAGATAGLAASLAVPALGSTTLGASLRPVVRPRHIGVPTAEALIATSGVSGVTAALAFAPGGAVIDAVGADVALPPASVAKAVTALYALDHLGAGYRFATVVIATGPVEGGVVQGDLILKGTGDPILDTDGLAELAQALRAEGVTGVTGRFLVDGRELDRVAQIDASQMPEAGYNPSVGGLNLNYNRVHFEWARAGDAYNMTLEARARAYQPGVRHATMTIVPAEAPVFTHALDGDAGERWTVARPALGAGGGRWLPVRLPALYAGDVFQTLAGSVGITLPAPERDAGPIRGTVLAARVSPTLRGLCGGMLKYSTNLTAEALGLRASTARGVAGAGLTGSAAEMNAWAKERFGADMAFVDHSGLGDGSRVSCAALGQVLRGAPELLPMLKHIKVKDGQGSVVEDAPYGIRAKTGTLNFVSSLAGYVTGAEGTAPLAFVIISADLERRSAIGPHDRERPRGAKSFARRARALQQALIARWARLEGKV
ncbi:MAG: D-alanyl-D-alanine carboxypeptidase/D-alanyl-D-alanine-endopeptidase [Pseudomonadota bacterium]